MSKRARLSQKYIEKIQGTEFEPLIKQVIGTQEPKSKEFLLGAERMPIKAISQLQEINAPEQILMMWYQILAGLAYELEQIDVFKGNE